MPKRPDPTSPCPCCSGKAYAGCCGPALRGLHEPADPAALMRSRFTAFVFGDAAWLWKTLHASHEDKKRGADEVQRELRRTCKQVEFRALRILDAAAAEGTGPARVLFLAEVVQRGQDLSFLERSDFFHDGTGWRYAGGTTRSAASVALPFAQTLATFTPEETPAP